MPKAVKALTLFTVILLTVVSASAQLKLPTLSPTVSDIKKVLQEYPNHFASITGELLRENEQSTDYECTIKVDGAEESFITKFPSKKNISTWETTLLTTEDFDKARQKYKSICNQLNNLSIKIEGVNYKINGTTLSLTEEMKFASSLYSLTPTDEAMKKLKVEVTAQFHIPMDWKVKVLIYEKEKDDDERGAQIEN